MDVSPELGHEDASFYQSQIGVLRWMVEMGRIDIITEVLLLASHLTMLLIENIPSLQQSLGCGPWSQAHMCLVVIGGVVVVGVARR